MTHQVRNPNLQTPEKPIDVCALGEILIDFTSVEPTPQGNPCFERNPGGAPANVLACLSRFGAQTVLLAKVGKDMFGDYLLNLLDNLGINKQGVSQDPHYRTTLAFVHLDARGDRSFSFYRNPGADIMLEPDDLDFGLIESARIFHCGSLSLTNEPAESATWAALSRAVHSGCLISYDPNLRAALWSNLDVAREKMLGPLVHTDILKLSGEELEFLTNTNDLEKGSVILYEEWKIPVILVTLATEGVFYRLGPQIGQRPVIQAGKLVDTTGAGDIFLGGFLYALLAETKNLPEVIKNLDSNGIEPKLDFALAAAALSITKRGAIPSIPELHEVQSLLKMPGVNPGN